MEMTDTAGEGDKSTVLKDGKILVTPLSTPSQFGNLLEDPILTDTTLKDLSKFVSQTFTCSIRLG